MFKTIFPILLCLVFVFSGCQLKNPTDTIKGHFDIRQCLGDEFGNDLGYSPTENEIISIVGDWISDKSIDLQNITVDMNFHDAVCEACYSCPTGERIFVEIDAVNQEDMEALDLLNLAWE